MLLKEITDNIQEFKTKERPGFGTDIYNDYGHVSILTGGKFSPALHSITDFVIYDESNRGKGYGDALIKEVIRRYKSDIGGQASSKASIVVLHNNGFRLYNNENSTIEDAFKIMDENSSVYMIKR
jgi:hypothetical protein